MTHVSVTAEDRYDALRQCMPENEVLVLFQSC